MTIIEPQKRALSVESMLAHLTGMGWVKASVLCQVLGTDERTIRGLASESRGEIISGDKGYHLTVEATPDEVRHAANRLRSQAAVMIERATSIEATHALKQQMSFAP